MWLLKIRKFLYYNTSILYVLACLIVRSLLCSHDGPVWQLAWAHPMFGNLIASCSYDKKVIIWKETNGSWGKLYEYTNHDSSGKF